MKTILASAALLAAIAAPASAQTVLVISMARDSGERASAPASLADRIEIAATRACGKPFIRDLAAQERHARCVAETRAEIEAELAGRAAAGQAIALR